MQDHDSYDICIIKYQHTENMELVANPKKRNCHLGIKDHGVSTLNFFKAQNTATPLDAHLKNYSTKRSFVSSFVNGNCPLAYKSTCANSEYARHG